jgi:hypothetical protein
MDNLEGFIPKFLKGGWIVTLIGAAGMIARLAVSEEENAMNTVIKNIAAAMIASSISWFILEQFEINSMIKAVTYGLVGLNSPEILKGITKISTSFSDDPAKFISNAKKGKITPTKKVVKKKPVQRKTSK